MTSDKYVNAGPWASVSPGNCLTFEQIPIGTFIHNIESRRGSGGRIVRAAGTKAQILRKTNEWSIVRLPSRRT